MIETFTGARVAVTGGSTGIGLALARRMARDGARISLCGLEAASVARARAQLESDGAAEVRAQALDITEDGALERWVGDTVAAFGGLDVGWNNAGVMATGAPVHAMDEADYARVMAVNLHAVFRGSQLFARRMMAQDTPGLLLNTGSENSLFLAVPGGGAAYVASKMAVRGLTESLRHELPARIGVKLLCPGFVDTPLGPRAQMRHGMDVERFADIVYPQLLEPERFYVASHGFNAVRIREQVGAMLRDVESGAAGADETARYDVRALMAERPRS